MSVTNQYTPAPSSKLVQGVENAGKVLKVNNDGVVEPADEASGLPEVTTQDNGKVLKVVNGEWDAAEGPDISGKADKVSSATNNNFASLDANGNLKDSGSKASDFLTSVPLAANGTRGGIQIGYTASGKNYPVKLSSEKAYVTIPGMDDTAFSGDIDTLLTPGRYYLNGATSTAESLSNLYGTLLVEGNTTATDGSRVTQLYLAMFSSMAWFRRYTSEGWQAAEYILRQSDIKNDLTTTTAGSVLDATQGKALNDGKKNTQSAVSDPSASGTSLTFIKTISQNTQGVITPTKATVSTMGAATSSAAGTAGLVPAPAQGDQAKFLRADATWQTAVTSIPLAANGTRGGVQVGYSETGRNYALKLSSEKGYVTVPGMDNASYSGDIDDLKTAGRYYLTGATSTVASLTSLYGTLLVLNGHATGSSERVTQLCIKITGGGTDIWARRYVGSWGDIQTIARQDDIYNGLDKTASGFALDARQGKALSDRFVALGSLSANDLPAFLKSVCDSFVTKVATTETSRSLPVKAAWSGNDYWTGTMARSGTGGRYINFILAANADRIAIGYYDANTSTLTNYRVVGCGVYKKPEELGLSGTPTILEIYNAMPTGGMALFESGNVASNDLPTSGVTTIVITKSGNSARGFIHAVTKNGSLEWTMGLYATAYNGNDANKPSGVWKRQITNDIISTTSGSTSTYTFAEATSFLLMTYRTGTSQTGAYGLYFGFAGTANSVLIPVVTPSTGVTVTISNLVLSVAASAGNVYAKVIF